MGGVINGSGFQKTFNNPSPGLLGTIVAIYEIGCCVGSLLTAFIGDRLGRRRTICLGAIVMLAGAGFQAGVSSSGPMIAARIVSVSKHCRFVAASPAHTALDRVSAWALSTPLAPS